jgi:hypothetical protein
MNWIAHLDTMTTILVSADAASFCISAAFFSERVRRWTYRKRWGSVPTAISHLDSVALAGMDDLSGGSIRLQPMAILRNPFDPRARETLTGGTAPQAHRDHSHRPTFRRSTVLQQRIAEYERTLADFALTPPEPRAGARPATPPTTGRLLNPRFEGFSIGHLQAAQPS